MYDIFNATDARVRRDIVFAKRNLNTYVEHMAKQQTTPADKKTNTDVINRVGERKPLL